MSADNEVQSSQSEAVHGSTSGGQPDDRTLVLKSDKGGLQIVLSRTAQVGWTVIGLAVFGWVAYSSYALISADFAIESKEKAIADTANKVAEVRGAYDDLITQVRTYQERFAEVSQQLANSQQRLVDLMGQNSQLKENLLLTTDRLKSAEDQASNASEQLGAKDSVLDGLLDENLFLKSDLASVRAELDAAMAEREKLKSAASEVKVATTKLSDREQAFEQLRVENGTLQSDVEKLRQQLAVAQDEAAKRQGLETEIKNVAVELSEKDSALGELLAENNLLKTNLDATTAKLGGIESERTELRKLVDQNSGLQTEFAALQGKLSTLENTELELNTLLDQNSDLRGELASAQEQMRVAEQRRAAESERTKQLANEIRLLEEEIEGYANELVIMSTAMASVESEAQKINDEHSDVSSDRKVLQSQVAQLENRIAALQRSQQDFLLYVTERTINTIDEAERTISMTGLGVEWLLERARNLPAALGGPFVELNASMLAASELRQEVSVLDSHMNRWERLQFILRMLPLAGPVDHYRVTSSYGKRKDPLNGRWAMHHGLDMAGPMRSPILATSAGTVTFAGWSASYGRTIEIDHGMGIRTRYGHLRSIAVKKGDRVKFREKIGLLGSSGRSTGPHLHYEILVDGKPVDPEDFLKAGKHLFKG